MPTTPASASQTPLTADSILELEIADLSVDGGALARHDGQVIFLDSGLPGARVLARVTGQRSRFARAVVEQELAPSPHAVAPHCPHVGQCGGCSWPGLSYEAECAWKKAQLTQSIQRIAKYTISDSCPAPEGQVFMAPFLPSPRHTGYRSKIELAFAPGPDGPVLGMKRRASHDVIPISDCPLARSPLAPLLAAVRHWLRDNALPVWDGKTGYLRHLVIRQPEYQLQGQPQYMVELITAPASRVGSQALGTHCAKAVQALGAVLGASTPGGICTAFIHSIRAHKAAVAYGEKVIFSIGSKHITEQVGHVVLDASPQAFMQANTGAAALLYAAVVQEAELSGTETVWDLYSGVGGIALTLAGCAAAVTGFESTPEAVKAAQSNALRNSVHNAEFVLGDVVEAISKERSAPDLVVLDPPRGGLDKELIRRLLLLGPATIIAVSCDPGTLARDIQLLTSPDSGTPHRYNLQRVQGIDMFPHTPHMEVVALLHKA